MDEIASVLQKTYLNNMDFLKKSYPNLYNKVINFESQNIENYFIEITNNHLNLTSVDGHSCYKNDPFIDAEDRVLGEYSRQIFSLINFDKITKNINKYEDIPNAANIVNEYVDVFNIASINPYNVAKKFIFIGTQLGIHINQIVANSKYENILVVEPNIEIFRLSMFVCNYELLAKQVRLFFLIDFDDIEYKSIIASFISVNFKWNHFIPFELASENERELIRKINFALIDNNEFNYPFSEYLISLKRGIKYICNNSYKLLNTGKNTILKDFEIVFIGAGPSLDNSRELLQSLQSRCKLVATSASLKKLAQFEIVPDVVILLDGVKDLMLKQFDVHKKYYENSIILASMHIDEDLLALFSKKNVFLFQDSLELFGGFGSNLGVNVGDVGIGLFLKLGCKKLHLIGIDACLSKTGKTHNDTHSLNQQFNLNDIDNNATGIDYDRDIFWAKGNKDGLVPTTTMYLQMIESLNSIFDDYKNEIIINHGDGAKFDNTIRFQFSIPSPKLSNEPIFDLLSEIAESSSSRSCLCTFDEEMASVSRMQTGDFGPQNTLSHMIYEKFEKLVTPYVDLTKNELVFANQQSVILETIMEALTIGKTY